MWGFTQAPQKCVFSFNSVWTLSTWGWYQAADSVPKTDPTITLFVFLEHWIWTGFPQPLLWVINLLECSTEGRKQRILKVHREWSQSSHVLSTYHSPGITKPLAMKEPSNLYPFFNGNFFRLPILIKQLFTTANLSFSIHLLPGLEMELMSQYSLPACHYGSQLHPDVFWGLPDSFLFLTYKENHIFIKVFMFLGVLWQPNIYFVLSLKPFVGF